MATTTTPFEDSLQTLQQRIDALTPMTTAQYVPIPPRGVSYRNKVVLAPMVRSGELPSRLLALHYGADLVWGPETVDRSMIGTTTRTNPRTGIVEWTRPPTVHAHHKQSKNNVKTATTDGDGEDLNIIFKASPGEKDRFVFQLGTNDPARAVEAATLVAPYCAGIDVNAGCPKPFSTSGGMGAALLKTESGDLLARILRALVAEVGTPHQIGISVKIRLLETPELTSALVHKLCQTGVTGLTIHCRTTPMRPREKAIREQLKMIGAICRFYGVACLMNGDVTSRDEGLALAEEHGVDGAMIATAAEANSSVFRTLAQGGPLPWKDVVQQYLRFCLQTDNKFGNTKFLLTQLIPGRESCYQTVCQSRSYLGICEALGYADQSEATEILEKAREVDEILGLGQPKVTKQDSRKANKAANRARHEANLQRKKAQGQMSKIGGNKRQRSMSPTNSPKRERGKSPAEQARLAADNAGFADQNTRVFERATATA